MGCEVTVSGVKNKAETIFNIPLALFVQMIVITYTCFTAPSHLWDESIAPNLHTLLRSIPFYPNMYDWF